MLEIMHTLLQITFNCRDTSNELDIRIQLDVSTAALMDNKSESVFKEIINETLSLIDAGIFSNSTNIPAIASALSSGSLSLF